MNKANDNLLAPTNNSLQASNSTIIVDERSREKKKQAAYFEYSHVFSPPMMVNHVQRK